MSDWSESYSALLSLFKSFVSRHSSPIVAHPLADFINQSCVGVNVNQLVHCCQSSLVLHKSNQGPVPLGFTRTYCLIEFSNRKVLQLGYTGSKLKQSLIRWHSASCCLRFGPANNSVTRSGLCQLICKQYLLLLLLCINSLLIGALDHVLGVQHIPNQRFCRLV